MPFVSECDFNIKIVLPHVCILLQNVQLTACVCSHKISTNDSNALTVVEVTIVN